MWENPPDPGFGFLNDGGMVAQAVDSRGRLLEDSAYDPVFGSYGNGDVFTHVRPQNYEHNYKSIFGGKCCGNCAKGKPCAGTSRGGDTNRAPRSRTSHVPRAHKNALVSVNRHREPQRLDSARPEQDLVLGGGLTGGGGSDDRCCICPPGGGKTGTPPKDTFTGGGRTTTPPKDVFTGRCRVASCITSADCEKQGYKDHYCKFGCCEKWPGITSTNNPKRYEERIRACLARRCKWDWALCPPQKPKTKTCYCCVTGLQAAAGPPHKVFDKKGKVTGIKQIVGAIIEYVIHKGKTPICPCTYQWWEYSNNIMPPVGSYGDDWKPGAWNAGHKTPDGVEKQNDWTTEQEKKCPTGGKGTKQLIDDAEIANEKDGIKSFYIFVRACSCPTAPCKGCHCLLLYVEYGYDKKKKDFVAGAWVYPVDSTKCEHSTKSPAINPPPRTGRPYPGIPFPRRRLQLPYPPKRGK